MKVMTVLGTRPEIIRLSRVIPALDGLCRHVVVHTGQNFDRRLHDIFYEELEVRRPDRLLDCRGETFAAQAGAILSACEKAFVEERPDRVLILGDTNSGLSALPAKRLGIPVYHMEAGNRCYDDRVPEEVNRRVIDHASDVLLPYTERSRANLLREGIAGERIFVTGNPIREVLDFYAPRIAESRALGEQGLSPGKYFLVTLHRSENVDVPERLAAFIEAFRALRAEYGIPVVVSLHPRTRSQLAKQARSLEGDGILAPEPFGLFDFIRLEKDALCVLSDSGTVQEECCLFRIPSVTLRDVTERPETLEAGSNMLSGADPAAILACVKAVLKRPRTWRPPREYLARDVSSAVVKIVLGHRCQAQGRS